ncbi:hypothetical protein [Halorhabdus rudnickae]|uniref:hypothetical protein n=1 Tax=Halorhabdus rudnickae TaxID=1775544 RepID=UPI0010840612|nr:hypothetical protein [Halorhabdus rudnickae]
MAQIGPPTIEQFSRLRPAFGRALVAAGFWSAVLLGLALLPLLLVASTRIDIVALFVACDVLCLLVGHRYDPSHDGDRRTENDGRQRITTGASTGRA